MERRRVRARGQYSGLDGDGSAGRLLVEGSHPPAALGSAGPAGEYTMRAAATAAALLMLAPAASRAGNKLTFDDRVELTRGLMAEYATVKQLLPRSKKPLPFEASGSWDKQAWEQSAKEFGPAARNGDLVQITKVDLEDDRIVLQINGGNKGGRKWYQGVEIGMGGGTVPMARGNSNAPSGTAIVILFHKPLEPVKAAAVKKM